MVEAVKGQAAADERRHKWSQVPGWMAVTHQHAGDQFRDHEDYAACCCAIQNFQLALWAQGVGTKWTTGDVTRHPEFLALLGLEPESTEVVGVIWFGYPAQVPTSRRQEVDQILVRHP